MNWDQMLVRMQSGRAASARKSGLPTVVLAAAGAFIVLATYVWSANPSAPAYRVGIPVAGLVQLAALGWGIARRQ